MTKKTTNKTLTDALDRATTLHSRLIQLSQNVPPQVSLADVIMQADELRSTLEEAHATEDA